MEKAQAQRFLARSVIGGPDRVREGVAAFVRETEVDEVMVVSDVFDHDKRLASYRMIAEVAGNLAEAEAAAAM